MLSAIAKAIIEEVSMSLLGLLPWPAWNVAVYGWVYGLAFALLMVALVWGRVSEFRVQQREAIANGRGHQHFWINAVFAAVVVMVAIYLLVTQTR